MASIQLAFASDSRYFWGLATAIATALQNTTALCGGTIHVLDGGLRPSEVRRIRRLVDGHASGVSVVFHSMDLGRFGGVKLLAGSPVTYARLLLPEIVAHLNEIIYLDVDVAYLRDLNELWSIPCSDYAVVAVQDGFIKTLGDDCAWLSSDSPERAAPYFNAGVIKINLDFWRRNRVGPSALELAQKDPGNCRFHDQTVLNYVLRGKVVWAPDVHNAGEPMLPLDPAHLQSKNIHFWAARKPWLQHSLRPGFRMWRNAFASLVSPFPYYQLSLRYWYRFFWTECVARTPVCVVLLATRIYRSLPRITEAGLRTRLRKNRSA